MGELTEQDVFDLFNNKSIIEEDGSVLFDIDNGYWPSILTRMCSEGKVQIANAGGDLRRAYLVHKPGVVKFQPVFSEDSW